MIDYSTDARKSEMYLLSIIPFLSQQIKKDFKNTVGFLQYFITVGLKNILSVKIQIEVLYSLSCL